MALGVIQNYQSQITRKMPSHNSVYSDGGNNKIKRGHLWLRNYSKNQFY